MIRQALVAAAAIACGAARGAARALGRALRPVVERRIQRLAADAARRFDAAFAPGALLVVRRPMLVRSVPSGPWLWRSLGPGTRLMSLGSCVGPDGWPYVRLMAGGRTYAADVASAHECLLAVVLPGEP